MPNFRRIGREAEDRAAEFLIGKGYTIITRRFSCHGGELDLVALDGDVLVFVEVKERRRVVVQPEEAVTATKISRLRRAARHYLSSMGEHERAHRFDLVAISPDEIRHHVEAF